MVTYTTPTTYAQIVALINGIEDWPIDCNDQAGVFYDLVARINAIELGWENLQSITLHVVQNTLPSLNDWQTAWEQAGYTLPISGNVYGLYESQSLATREVGEYIWYDGLMQPMHARYWQGSSEITKPFTPNPADGSNSGSVALAAPEVKRFDFPVAMKLTGWLTFQMGFSVNTVTTLQWRTNFESANATYRQVDSSVATANTLNINIFPIINYLPTARQNTAFNGSVEIWFRTNVNGATVHTSYILMHLNTLPGFVEAIYD